DLEELARVAVAAIRGDRPGPQPDRPDPHRRVLLLDRSDDLAERAGTVVVAERLAGIGSLERLASMDRGPGVKDVEVRRRCRNAVHAVEAAIDPDRPGRPDDRSHDCESERDDGRNGEHAPPAGWRRQDDGGCEDEQSLEWHTERQRGDDARCEA